MEEELEPPICSDARQGRGPDNRLTSKLRVWKRQKEKKTSFK